MNKKDFQNICIFCGSRSGKNTVYKKAANTLGKLIGQHKKTLYYGCGSTGLMRETAKAASENHARVIGVIPRFFMEKVVEQESFAEKIQVDTMDQRKVIMAEKSDVFIALPGGFGTLDELFEILSLIQLELKEAVVFLLNTNQFYTPLIQQLDKMEEEDFLSKEHRRLLHISNTPEELFEELDLLHKKRNNDL